MTILEKLEPRSTHILAFKIGAGLGLVTGFSFGVIVGVKTTLDIQTQRVQPVLEVIEGTAVEIV